MAFCLDEKLISISWRNYIDLRISTIFICETLHDLQRPATIEKRKLVKYILLRKKNSARKANYPQKSVMVRPGPANHPIQIPGFDEMDEIRLHSPDNYRMNFDDVVYEPPPPPLPAPTKRSFSVDVPASLAYSPNSNNNNDYKFSFNRHSMYDRNRNVCSSGFSDIISFPNTTITSSLPTTDRSSRRSLYSRRATMSALGITKQDPLPVYERQKRLESLLTDIYEDRGGKSVRLYPYRGDSDSLTDTSMTFSEKSSSFNNTYTGLSMEKLGSMTIERLKEEIDTLHVELEYANSKLVRAVKQRFTQRNRVSNKSALLTAVLQAMSEKKSSDARLRFSLEPSKTENGFDEWKNAMRAVAKLPGGVPAHFRKKLWTTLADQHISTLGVAWEDILSVAFCEKILPEDEELTSQIIKDLHRTGWEGFNENEEQMQLKRVLLGYARYNKDVGYCQGFNVIGALILQIVDYKTDVALKILIFLLEQVLPCGYFDQSLRALSVDMAVLKDLLHQRLPKTIVHLEMLQTSSGNEFEPPLTNVFSMHWLLTLYATCLPPQCVFRIWDAVMLEGSEVLLRTSLAIWAKLSRKILKTTTADEFYVLMEVLSKQLQDMKQADQDNLITVIYSMCEFPYPGLTELRDKYTWNIQPLSDNFRLFQKSVHSILRDDASDEEGTGSGSTTCSPRRSRENNQPKKADLQILQKQYHLMKVRQKQASLILKSAYDHGQKAVNSAKARCIIPNPLFTSQQQPVFNHLQMGHEMAKDDSIEPPASITGGAVAIAPTIVQPTGPIDFKQSRLRITAPSQRPSVLEDEEAKTTRESTKAPGQTEDINDNLIKMRLSEHDSGRDSEASTPTSGEDSSPSSPVSPIPPQKSDMSTRAQPAQKKKVGMTLL